MLGMNADELSSCSIVSGTPPSIRIDASIRAAPAIIDELGVTPQISNLFGEVELTLIWEQVSVSVSPMASLLTSTKSSLRQHGLGEWWCLPEASEHPDEALIESMLKETDSLIDAWYRKWWDYINHGTFHFSSLPYKISNLLELTPSRRSRRFPRLPRPFHPLLHNVLRHKMPSQLPIYPIIPPKIPNHPLHSLREPRARLAFVSRADTKGCAALRAR